MCWPYHHNLLTPFQLLTVPGAMFMLSDLRAESIQEMQHSSFWRSVSTRGDHFYLRRMQ
jgi:hypothetical protein